MTKIFCDIADIKLLKNLIKKKFKRFYNKSHVDEKSWSQNDYTKYSKKIIKITNKPVSCEVFADEPVIDMIFKGK